MLTQAAAKPAAYTSHIMHSTNLLRTKTPAAQLLMPKYLLITPTGKSALIPAKNSYQTTWKIQIFDFLTDLSWMQGRKMKKAHFTVLHFRGGGDWRVQTQTTSLSWTIPQERKGGQHQFSAEPLGSKLRSPALVSTSFNNLAENKVQTA